MFNRLLRFCGVVSVLTPENKCEGATSRSFYTGVERNPLYRIAPSSHYVLIHYLTEIGLSLHSIYNAAT